MKITFEPVTSPHEGQIHIESETIKQAVSSDFREKELIGVPDPAVRIDFSPSDGSDILIKKIDPEEALGNRLFKSEDDYYEQMRLDQFSEADAAVSSGVTNG